MNSRHSTFFVLAVTLARSSMRQPTTQSICSGEPTMGIRWRQDLRNLGINHKLVQLLGLAHAQWLEPVAGLAAAHGEFIARPVKVKTGGEAISFVAGNFLLRMGR